jgi:guanine deaminase
LADEMGRLEPGRMADVTVWNWAHGAVGGHRDQVAQQRMARDLHERVFAWMTLGDERNLASTYVAGQCVHQAAH